MSWPARLLILALFAAVVGLPVLWRPPAPQHDPAALRLVVITPHAETIRFEIAHAFDLWHRRNFGPPVRIDWRFMGTSDMRKQLLSAYRALASAGNLHASPGYDLAFGGGDFEYDRILKPGFAFTDPAGQTHRLSITQPIELPPDLIALAYPSPTIADKKLYDPDGHWWGVVLASFGIAFNRDVLRDRNLPEPLTWDDLTDFRYFSWIALADPSKSGSINVTYDTIVQRYGWDRGWKTLRRIAANARYFSESSSKIPVDVAAGEAAAGMCIDFYGRYQAQVVGGNRVGFVAPADATVVNADPVAVLRGVKGDRLELATRFVTFLLTLEGQALWSFRKGEPMGPVQFELRRPPVRREIYQHHMDKLVDQIDPFDLARPLPPDTPSYFRPLPVALQSMAIDIHDDLKAAWRAINRETDPARRARMIELFDALPFTQAELLAAPARWNADRGARNADRLAWTRFFRDRYRQIAAMAH